MFVYVTTSFEDREHEGVGRRAGSLLLVSDARGKQIIKAGYGRAIEVIDLLPKPEKAPAGEAPEEVEAEEAEPAEDKPKKASRKKAD